MNKKKQVSRSKEVDELSITIDPLYKAGKKLEGKVALITGGDSGIGRAVAVHYAKEGADVAIVYHVSDEDAKETQVMVEQEGRTCLLFKGDIAREAFCRKTVQQVVKKLGKLSILVNNAGRQEVDEDFLN